MQGKKLKLSPTILIARSVPIYWLRFSSPNQKVLQIKAAVIRLQTFTTAYRSDGISSMLNLTKSLSTESDITFMA